MDHVLGLPFFRPAYDKRNRFEFWSGHLKSQGRRLEEVLDQLMQPPFFPVPLDIMHACIAFHDFSAGERIELGDGVAVRTAALNHPGGAVGYRVEFAGRVGLLRHRHRARARTSPIRRPGADPRRRRRDLRRHLHRRGVRAVPGLGPLDLAGGRAPVRGGGRAAAGGLPPRSRSRRRRAGPDRRRDGAPPRPARSSRARAW